MQGTITSHPPFPLAFTAVLNLLAAMRISALILFLALGVSSLTARPPAPEVQEEEGLAPAWETRREARTFLFTIPAPRGQITDRNGHPLAQTRVGHNLAVEFPRPLNFDDRQALAYARQQIAMAEALFDRNISISDNMIIEHYRNRGLLPMDIVSDLLPAEFARAERGLPDGLTLRPLYLRYYPNGSLAGHIIGYAGRMGRQNTRPIENFEMLWPELEGREGLELTFNEQLTGHPGQINMTFNENGVKTSEKISIPPEPGNNVITTLDLDLQRAAENVLSENAKRGAIVVLDPNNGDILAMASWPSIDPNAFVPVVTSSVFQALQDDPDIPLLPRAYRSAYPPGSAFKMITGIAALEQQVITPTETFPCPTAYNVGNLVFRNWKDEHAGDLNFRQALTQSCNTWFYQVGIRTGGNPIVHWAQQLGFGARSNIPVRAETSGRVPDHDYMRATYGRPFLDGDLANISIGQGDLLVSPLQMAQAMAAIANGGSLYQTRLVSQVQNLQNEVVTAYGVRVRRYMEWSSDTLAEVQKGMEDVVNSGSGTAAQARVPGVTVAGKTGTAQWGPKHRERTAAWFAGYVPAENPQYAFAALYEGTHGERVMASSKAAPLIGKLFRGVYEDKEARLKDAVQTASHR